jgi:dTDP-4-dehydrorhamnose 3,5-epimerase-like enzyme
MAPHVTLIEPLLTHCDSRGSLFEPLNDQELARQKNVHVVLTQPNAVRGNHLHHGSVEMTTVVGPCLVRLKESGVMRDVTVPPGETWRFTIPPGVVHAYRNTGDAAMVMVSFNSHVHNASSPDTVQEQIL